jgi:hypothetical protein
MQKVRVAVALREPRSWDRLQVRLQGMSMSLKETQTAVWVLTPVPDAGPGPPQFHAPVVRPLVGNLRCATTASVRAVAGLPVHGPTVRRLDHRAIYARVVRQGMFCPRD